MIEWTAAAAILACLVLSNISTWRIALWRGRKVGEKRGIEGTLQQLKDNGTIDYLEA